MLLQSLELDGGAGQNQDHWHLDTAAERQALIAPLKAAAMAINLVLMPQWKLTLLGCQFIKCLKRLAMP